jgi:hypothetical protein
MLRTVLAASVAPCAVVCFGLAHLGDCVTMRSSHNGDPMSRTWSVEELGQLLRAYQPACILMAAAELDLFGTFAGAPFTASQAAAKLVADPRGMTVLLDALAALHLLDKQDDRYSVPSSLAPLLTHGQPGSQLAMVQHQATCLRRWSQLASIVKTGQLPPRLPSIRGESADYASFIEAMDNASAPAAAGVVASLLPLQFSHLLDVGGASGSWTIAFLRTNSTARATIFDLPQVIPQARQRIERAGLSARVELSTGDFYVDPLPRGADLAWVSAIVHQNSRDQNRALFERIHVALVPGGRLLIRDFLMEPSRTRPVGGALFAVNMLAGTSRGGTFTVEELTEDLASAGFDDVVVLRRDETMHSVLSARKR